MSKRKDYIRQERMSESFCRTATMPEAIKYEEVSADLKDGLLQVVLPKKNPTQRKKTAIKQPKRRFPASFSRRLAEHLKVLKSKREHSFRRAMTTLAPKTFAE
jgi:Hsp20/alpha crystallin family